MISLIKGTIEAIGKNYVVVMTEGGVGYNVNFRDPISYFQIGQQTTLFTYLKVSDVALDLYGFQTIEERQFFELLMTVSGVGPKTAMNVLSLGSIDQIQSAIARGDVKYLTAVQGMGKKTAERLVVELKSKIQESGIMNNESDKDSQKLSEVIDGLCALGYSNDEAKKTVQQLEEGGKSTEQLLREALRQMR